MKIFHLIHVFFSEEEILFFSLSNIRRSHLLIEESYQDNQEEELWEEEENRQEDNLKYSIPRKGNVWGSVPWWGYSRLHLWFWCNIPASKSVDFHSIRADNGANVWADSVPGGSRSWLRSGVRNIPRLEEPGTWSQSAHSRRPAPDVTWELLQLEKYFKPSELLLSRWCLASFFH